MSPSDAALIVRCLQIDDRNAFAELVRRHQSDVRRLLRRLTSDDARADDLAQETFLRAYQALAQFRGGARFSTWLYRIAYNMYLAQARKAAAPEVQPSPPKDAIAGVIARHDLLRALIELKPEERAALALTYGEEVTHEEAAEILDCPLGTLKTHVSRGKEKLRIRLEASP